MNHIYHVVLQKLDTKDYIMYNSIYFIFKNSTNL